MPKRLLDGEKLWRSDKLLKIEPKEFRAEYANLLPLALADGSFECDPCKVWSLVYAYNRSEISVDRVKEILDEFERVKLLFRWQDRDKKCWGFWVGIDQEGLLPSPSQRDRYKVGKLPPKDKFNIFINKEIEKPLDNIQSESGLGQARLALALAVGLEGLAGEENMSLRNNITDNCRKILGVRISASDQGWDEIKSLARVYGPVRVESAFEQWAESADDRPNYPLTAFVRVADSILAGDRQEVKIKKALILELSYLSDNRVTFNNKQSLEIARLAEQYNDEEIKSAFREFFEGLDEFSIKFAAKDFAEKAEQFIYTQQKRKELQVRIAAQMAEMESTPVVVPDEEPFEDIKL